VKYWIDAQIESRTSWSLDDKEKDNNRSADHKEEKKKQCLLKQNYVW